MKRLALAAALSSLTFGCATGGGSSSMGYVITDAGVDGCAFRYGFYPYYDSHAVGPSGARIEIVRVERPRVPRAIDRTGWTANADSRSWNAASSGGPTQTVPVISERPPVVARAPPPAPRAVEPRS